MNREKAFPGVNETDPDVSVATADALGAAQALPMTDAAYMPGVAFDEMYVAGGDVRRHYAGVHTRLTTLSPEALADRQKTLERSFLLQGITFTVYGAEATTERIIPTDLVPRIIPAQEWKTIEEGLTQRLRALNMFLADI